MNARFRIKGVCNISLGNVEAVYKESKKTCIDYYNKCSYEVNRISFETNQYQHELIEQAIHDYLETLNKNT
jgi:hypothetical protein